MNPRCWLKMLLVLALALPVVECVLIGVRGLLHSMGDQAGAAIVGYVGAVCLAVWSVSLVGLVILLAVVVLMERPLEDDTGT
jgi:hypothetical protein